MAVAQIGSLEGAKDAINAGVGGLAHLFIDTAPDQEFAALAAGHHVFVVPTLSVLASITRAPAGKLLAEDPRLLPWLSPASVNNPGGLFSKPSRPFLYPHEEIRMLQDPR